MTTHPRWPHALLDTRRQRPVPFRQFVLKVHGRCNLDCGYCYLYRGQDQGWRDRPARVAERTMHRTATRIADHVRTHGLDRVRIELHGGEPLLTGPGPVLAYTRAVRAAVPADCAVTATVQTNGTRLTAPVLDRLAEEGVRVGLSLDGGRAGHNARRVDHAGRPAWPAARAAARRLAERPESYAGILCTIDLAADPLDVYHSLLELAPPGVDFLLPHANWRYPPPGIPGLRPGRHRPRPTPYGDWLTAVFDAWWDADRPLTRIRLFQEIAALLLGAPSAAEAVGLSPVAAVVVETDGAVEQVDSLRSAYAGASETGLDVFRHSFDQALRHPGVAARQLGERALAEECVACPVGKVCGGGNYVHRYAPGTGFRHPSVYCADLERLIRHIAGRLERTVRGPA
ncbi:FxsB family cyclophane-forming radical SAM/SPASM peptide maturase [Streptomyces sp. NL15-2K]|uniref:FxsB family cyclophane-forming radical SAM/SPASM peptide maturase n=1 Tax=Streptomyces sp. NL15-2K TaxID=376149 RepID=UPI000FF947B1|nr:MULTISPECIES: FxsB family cyclophane-forming radical SAM/SPASM peptide maturase [Actinomycetes]WKX12501.1 FxsB family cyclophane-forming radical SAM/SPASM peptide maturase [Kutzneria buriramensis]GCB45987.1 transcriptional regulator [Streptomyces sp. NL15-2K]